VVTHPYLTDHGGRLHLHYAPAEADPLHRVQASTAMGLAIVLCDYGMARLGVCRAPTASACTSTSPATRSAGLLGELRHRTNVAAFRARAKSTAATATLS
jgi:hypothetical protein